jgi:hypothetical protein
MRNTAILFASLVLIVTHLNAEETVDLDPNVRPAGEVILKFEHKIDIAESKRFKDGMLLLFPGDIVHLEFEEKDGVFLRPKVVAKVQDPKRTITFRMTQNQSVTMLFRESKIQKTVSLDCEHQGLDSENFSNTNLNPTEKGLTAGDSWPNSVWLLRLSNIEVTSRPASEVYKEKVSKNRAPEDVRK